MKDKIKISPAEEYDRLCQEYGTTPFLRSYEFGALLERKEGYANRVLPFVVLTRGIKSDGNDVIPTGVELTEYMRNPQFFWAHNRSDEPIGRAVSITHMGRGRTSRIEGDFEFMGPDLSERADRIFKMYTNGFLNAVSIGAKILKAEPLTEESYKEIGLEAPIFPGILITNADLKEVSAVPLPADKDAFMKRFQQGDLDLDEFTHKTDLEYEDESGKCGIFYVQGKSFNVDKKVIVDMKPEKKPDIVEQEDETVEISFDENIAKIISDLATKDQLTLNSICFNDEYNDNYILTWANTYFDSADITIESNKIVFNDYYGETITVPLDDGIVAQYVPPEKTERMFCGAVPFSSHGVMDVDFSESWNPLVAKTNLIEWAEDSFQRLKRGFAWADQNNKDPISGLKLLHHNVIDGKLVTSKIGVMNSIQRLMQRCVNIPESDIQFVREHLAEECKLIKEQIPWNRSLGEIYQDIHTRLAHCRYSSDSERDTLRRSAESIATQLFGEHRLREPWQDRSILATSDSVWASILYSVGAVVGDLVNDTEELDARIDKFISFAEQEYLKLFNDFNSLKRTYDTIKDKYDIKTDSLDLTNELNVDEEDYDLTEKLERLEKQLSEDSEPDQRKESLVIDRLLRRVEELSSSGSSGDNE